MKMKRKVLLGDPPAIQITNHDFGRLDMFLAKSEEEEQFAYL